ncbi:MAG: antibiotic biosynthesis monooxygenase family protein [Kofleriaceae bacterium]
MTNTDTITMEWAPFRVRPGVTEQEVRDAAEALQRELLANQSGFLRRELLRDEHGGYVDLIWWESRAAAEAIMSALAGSAAFARFLALMAGDTSDPSGGVRHFSQLASYAR